MSVDYNVIVPKGRWPSFAALNAAMAARGFPVELMPGPGMAPEDAVRSTPRTLGLRVLLDGRPVELEASGEAHDAAAYPDDETNDVLAEIGATVRLNDGDHVFGVALRSSSDEWIAASYVMASLVLDFHGYGYETQADSHGREDWADDLIEGARQGYVLPDPPPAPEAPPPRPAGPAPVAAAAVRSGFDWFVIFLWACAGLVILTLVIRILI